MRELKVGYPLDVSIPRSEPTKETFIARYLIARYLTETKAKIEDTMLVEQHMKDGTSRYWCEPKPVRDKEADDKAEKLHEIAEVTAQLAHLQNRLSNLLR